MSRPRVLVVDDNTEFRNLILEALQVNGFAVSEARDGAEALRLIADDGRPDVILLDLLMPGMDGAEFLDKLRAAPENRGISVVVATGVASAHVRKLIPADAFLFKPFTIDELTSVVRRLSERTHPPA